MESVATSCQRMAAGDREAAIRGCLVLAGRDNDLAGRDNDLAGHDNDLAGRDNDFGRTRQPGGWQGCGRRACERYHERLLR